ncbi:hypothetical protein [Methanofollis tationis]|uniref:Uncharacterized protein n=1 Tax=Methanofollis tationis TaxID=81417 RepID=A0A7K4HP28_9EURY|nr:hypothetical protein [Methanofollis tationis]NVO67011.1 hypothetical protein [Methanofollis tationis]
MREETVVEAGEARVAAGRAIVPIVRTQTIVAGPGLFLTAELIGLVIAGEGWVRLFSCGVAEVPDDIVARAVGRAREALSVTSPGQHGRK